jgi:hypothetical protein
VLQTWQTAAGGGWRPLPAAPQIASLSVSSTNPVAGATVQISWGLGAPAGCTPRVNLRLAYLSGATPYNLPLWEGASAGPGTFTGTATFTTSSDTRVEMRATCREHVDSGFVTEDFESVTVRPRAPQPPPPPPPTRVSATYQTWLVQDVVYSGALSFSAYFGQGIYGGQLTSLTNPNPYHVSLIYPFGDNNDCFVAGRSVTLAPYQTTTASDLSLIYGTTVPGLPIGIRGCANVGLNGYLPINVSYSYLQ